jgi:hypothetical protein
MKIRIEFAGLLVVVLLGFIFLLGTLAATQQKGNAEEKAQIHRGNTFSNNTKKQSENALGGRFW